MHSLAAADTKPLFGLDWFIKCFFVQTNCKSLFSLLQNGADIKTLAGDTYSALSSDYRCHFKYDNEGQELFPVPKQSLFK